MSQKFLYLKNFTEAIILVRNGAGKLLSDDKHYHDLNEKFGTQQMLLSASKNLKGEKNGVRFEEEHISNWYFLITFSTKK